MSLSNLNVFLAQAGQAAAPAAQPGQQPPAWMQVAPFAFMFVMLYFVMIRPQSKKAKEHAAMLKSLKAGDKVITASGIVGIVVSVKDSTVSIRSAETKLEILQSAITTITERGGETATEN